MDRLRTMVLVLAVAAVPLSAMRVVAQQEVDPDHFDQPIAAKQATKAPAHKLSAQQHAHGRTSLASKHAKQHHSHATA